MLSLSRIQNCTKNGWRKHLEMMLLPNDEEVASTKIHTQFKSRVHKPYPISDQNRQNSYPFSDQNG